MYLSENFDVEYFQDDHAWTPWTVPIDGEYEIAAIPAEQLGVRDAEYVVVF